MGVKFKSPLELSGHRAITHTDVAQTLVVKVVTKTNSHPEYGNGSSNGYTIDGVEGAYLEFTPGNTYKFDQSDNSNSGHPLLFYEDAAKTTAYTTGVTNNHGSTAPGNSGSYTQIIPTVSTPPILYYQCSNHGLMGSYVKFGTGTIGDTYAINVTQDGNDVDLKLDAASGTDSTVQLTAGSNITLTRNNAQEVTIASTASGGISGINVQDEGSALSTAATTLNFTGSGVTASGTGATKTINVTGGGGSSGGTVTVEKNVYTANGSTTTFNTTSAIANENNVQVYLDGVYQSKDNYTTNASTVTISTAPANNTSVELIHMVSVAGVIARDSFTGNGSTTAYVLSMSILDENATQVYLDGVYQSKDNYSTSSSTLTFSTAPPNGTAIEVVHIKAVNASSLNQNNFTGNGSTTAFTLSQTVDDEAKTFVFIQGVYQEKSTYSISGSTLTFSTAPQNGYTIEVMAFSTITVGNQAVTSVNGQTGAVTLETGTDWQSTIQTSNFTAVAGKGYFVNTTSASVTVTLPAGTVGDEIVFQDYAGTFGTNKVIFDSNGSEKIQGSTDNFQNTTNNSTITLVYQDATKGWNAQNVSVVPTNMIASGGTETTSGGKKYHKFTSSGTLNVTTAGDYEYLIVAGGGGGGFDGGGGGGAGGLLQSSGTVTSTGNYTITVGAGGSGASGYNITPATGNNSTITKSGFTAITADGGGGASRVNSSGYAPVVASNGGSGGGGMSSSSNQASNGGSGITGQGNDGGDGLAGATWKGAGGGGAGTVGANSATNAGGNGGDGLQYSTWATATSSGVNSGYYAGGGGGACESTGTRGSGGNGGGGSGGAAGSGYTAVAGTPNTGGGGGGGDAANDPGKSGGSGIVIIRYNT